MWRHCFLPVLLCWAASLALAFGVLILTIVPWLRAPAISHAAVYPVLFVIFGSFFNAFAGGWTIYLPLVLVLVGAYILIRNFTLK